MNDVRQYTSVNDIHLEDSSPPNPLRKTKVNFLGQRSVSMTPNNTPALLRIGETSTLPLMLCGLLQKEMVMQQRQQHQQQQMQQHFIPNPQLFRKFNNNHYEALSSVNSEYFNQHRPSMSSSYSILILYFNSIKSSISLYL